MSATRNAPKDGGFRAKNLKGEIMGAFVHQIKNRTYWVEKSEKTLGWPTYKVWAKDSRRGISLRRINTHTKTAEIAIRCAEANNTDAKLKEKLF
jgi:hypothetical protein